MAICKRRFWFGSTSILIFKRERITRARRGRREGVGRDVSRVWFLLFIFSFKDQTEPFFYYFTRQIRRNPLAGQRVLFAPAPKAIYHMLRSRSPTAKDESIKPGLARSTLRSAVFLCSLKPQQPASDPSGHAAEGDMKDARWVCLGRFYPSQGRFISVSVGG